MALIFYLSHQPDWPEAAKGSPDWVLHGGAYVVLTVALWYGCSAGKMPPHSATRCIVLAAIAASLYGLSDEWHQSFIPGRAAAWEDWLADSVGAVFAALGLLGLKFAGLRG